MKKYDTAQEQFPWLVHIDAYRIEEEEEMTPLRFSEELENKEALIAIEWAENISNLLPASTTHIYFEHNNDERLIKVVYAERH
jgi:tRNA A37 threonylcarbamoyladenosine biosynthesis protein TsaE